jgi:hypothetical protein
MRFVEYERWLTGETSKLIFEPSSTVIGLYSTPTIQPNNAPWQTELTVVFSDGKFFRVCETWYRRKGSPGGGGYRGHFSFHYGPANPSCDSEGVPTRSKDYPAIIRIDEDDRIGPHLHFAGENHIPQRRVQNLRISDADMFDFIRAVQTHRANGEGFDKILKFTVNP